MLSRSIFFVLLTTSLCVSTPASADERDTTVALTVALPQGAGPAERNLAGPLLALLEVELSGESKLSVVERRQIDLALQELALAKDLGRNAASKARLGKIASADLIVTLELQKPDDNETHRVLIRIVESLTGRIRGVSVTPVEITQVDEAASQIAQYVTIVAGNPESPPVTVAVAPFESKGRFDRLRPLELGLRDMIATRLRKWSRVSARNNPEQSVLAFQVLQRSSMRDLLQELDLIQSGLVDQSRLPETLPNRAAAFLVRGEIDEKNDGGTFRIVVTGELVHAASNKVVRDFQFETVPNQLEQRLAHAVNLLAGRLITSQGEVSETPGPLRELHETDSLFGKVAADLKRFQRIRPTDFSYRDYELPGRIRASGAKIVRASDPLGVALLKKSIDRLESILFVRPDHAGAAFSLGWAYSFHLEGIINLDRAEELLKRAAGSDPDGELGAAALRLLAEVNYHHQRGRVPDDRKETAVRQLHYMFMNMPEEHRDHIWLRLPYHFSESFAAVPDHALTMQIVEFVADKVEREGPEKNIGLATGAGYLIEALNARKDQSDGYGVKSMSVMEHWGNSEDGGLKRVAAWSLAHLAQRRRDPLAAAEWYLAGANTLADATSRSDLNRRDNFRMHAARQFRAAGKKREARELLESYTPVDPESLNTAYHAIELARCLMEDGEKDRALDLLITTGERVPAMRDNTPLEQLIRELGGVPIREDTDIEVSYLKFPKDVRMVMRALATDGQRLFGGGGLPNGAVRGVVAYDPRNESWEVLTTAFGKVVDLEYRNGSLWVGTESEGIWRCTMPGNQWTQITTEQGLPDNRINSVAAYDDGVYAGVGTGASGGVVQLTSAGEIIVLDGEHAPTTAPLKMAVQDGHLLTTTGSTVLDYDPEEELWTRIPGTGRRYVFAGSKHAWVSKARREIAPLRADDDEAKLFSAAWQQSSQYSFRVEFCLEHKGQVWFGGWPTERFQSAGFYRIDPKTGEFRIYNPRDGFRMSLLYATFDGVAIGDDMWIATSGGLARVTPK